MRDEVPAALPLISFAVAAALSGWLVNAPVSAVALALAAAVAWHHARRTGVVFLFAAFGLAAAIHSQSTARRDREAVARARPDRFVTVEAAIDHDWIARGHVYVLRSPEFTVDGTHVDSPISVYARFTPRPIEMQRAVRAEGFLRRDPRGRYTLSVKSPRLLTYTGTVSRAHPATWNRIIAARLRRHSAAHPDEIAMIDALVLGRDERLSDSTRDGFKRGGTYHLLVFSGLQIALAAATIAALLRWLGTPRVSDWSLMAFACIAPLFIGPTASVSRASAGVALYAASRIFRRPTTFENLWCVAALLRLAMAPSDLADPAFQLTYAGAGALLFVGKPLAETRMRWVAYALAAEIAVAPITLFHFHQYALGGSVMTIVMTPIIFIMLLVGAAFCAIEWTALLKLLAFLNATCEGLNRAAAPASGFFHAPPAWTLALGFGIAVLAIATLRGRLRTATVIAALCLPTAAAIYAHLSEKIAKDPQVIALDVGQGDAIVIRSGSRTLLVDGGGRADDLRFGEAVLVPLLVDRGITHVDVVVLTHVHPDHCGGVPAVMERLTVGEMWISPMRFRGECAQRVLETAHRTATPIRLLRGGYVTNIGEWNVRVHVAHHPYRRASENNSSVVLRLAAHGRGILLTGDIEKEAEADLAAELPHSDVLKVPHHGSRSSTTGNLLDAVAPRLAIISCGYANLFGHPHPMTLDALSARRVRVLRTDRNGSITVTIRGNRIYASAEIDTSP